MSNNVNPTDPNALRTPVTSLQRTKYFPMELHGTGLLANAKHDAYYNGALVNAFCKPFGGLLGDPLVSDPTGKITILYLLGIPYNQTYLVNSNPDNETKKIVLAESTSTFELRNPFGRSSFIYIPIKLKM